MIFYNFIFTSSVIVCNGDDALFFVSKVLIILQVLQISLFVSSCFYFALYTD